MKYFPKDVDPSLCTHVIYAFAQIGAGHTLAPIEWNDDKMFGRFAQIKQVQYLITLSKTAKREVLVTTTTDSQHVVPKPGLQAKA